MPNRNSSKNKVEQLDHQGTDPKLFSRAKRGGDGWTER